MPLCPVEQPAPTELAFLVPVKAEVAVDAAGLVFGLQDGDRRPGQGGGDDPFHGGGWQQVGAGLVILPGYKNPDRRGGQPRRPGALLTTTTRGGIARACGSRPWGWRGLSASVPQFNKPEGEAVAVAAAPWARIPQIAKPCKEDKAAAHEGHSASTHVVPPSGSPSGKVVGHPAQDHSQDREKVAQAPRLLRSTRLQPTPESS